MSQLRSRGLTIVTKLDEAVMFPRNLFLIAVFGLLPWFAAAAAVNEAPLPMNSCILEPTRLSSTRYQLAFKTTQEFVPLWSSQSELPAPTRWVAIPFDGTVTIKEIDRKTVNLSSASSSFLSLCTRPIPSELVEIGNAAAYQGITLVPITVNPLIADGDGVSLVERLMIEVNIPAGDIGWSGLSHEARLMWSDLLLNNPGPSRDEGGEGAGYVYVLPPDNRVSELLEPLYDWRRQQGFDVHELVIDENFDGRELSDRIRALNDAFGSVEYICLVGDVGGEFNVPTLLQGTSDYGFAMMNDDDYLPEAAVGRLSYSSVSELRRMLDKIIAYEQEPDVNDPGWLRRGAVCAGNRLSGLSTILVSRWVRDRLLEFGFTQVDTLWYTMNQGVEDYMQRVFDRGSAFVNYRGWTGMEDLTPLEALHFSNHYLPVAVLIGCNTGDFEGINPGYTEALLRADGGAIGAIGCATAQTRVNYNNAMLAGFYRGVLRDKVVRLGWALNRAKIELFATYGVQGREWVLSHAYWTNLMGDPATVMWLGVPQPVDIAAPAAVAINFDPFDVRVTRNGQPVVGVRVGVEKENELVTAAWTGENGVARIFYDPRRVHPGQALITVTGDRVRPSTRQFQFNAQPHLLTFNSYFVMDDNMDPHQGNGNSIIEPFEIFDMFVNFNNIGNAALPSPINLTLTTQSDAVEIINGNAQIFQPINPNQMGQGRFMVQARGNFPDREAVPMTLNIRQNMEQFALNFNVLGRAPRWSFAGFDQAPVIQPGREATFRVTLRNTGSLDVDAAEAELVSLSDWCLVLEAVEFFEGLPAGIDSFYTGDGVLEVSVDEEAPLESYLDLELRLTSNTGYLGTVPIKLYVPAQVNVPLVTGPDAYGYYAIDNNDNISNIFPTYRWVEINPALGGRGRSLGLLDQGEDDDKSVAVELPFPFQYYGEVFDRLTVCVNGWAAFGDQSQYTDFRNLPIGAPQGPRAQLCPWWDDLYQPGRSGDVFAWYDEVNHLYIVEWSSLRRWVGPDGPGAVETFELFLRDPAWHQTYTGDGDIIFQYATVTREARVDGYGTPYATIGIGNLDDTGGLQLSYWNSNARGIGPIQTGTAIRFSTANRHRYANLSGEVRTRDGLPVNGAVVRASTGGWTVTNDQGAYANLQVLSGLAFRLHASGAGFNESVSNEMQLAENQNQVVNFTLTRPQIALDVQEVIDTLRAGMDGMSPFTIHNNGDGPLNFNISFAPPEGDGLYFPVKNGSARIIADLWDPLADWNISEVAGDNRILGVAFFGGSFWISGSANGADDNFFYRLDREGRLVDRLPQPCVGSWGLNDLAWDGIFLYGGCRSLIYKMNVEGELVETMPSPLIPPRAMAVDPESGDIYIANDGEPIHRLRADGSTARLYAHRLRPYGLAWHPNDEDGCSLYIFSADGEHNLALSKLDPVSGVIRFVTQLELQDGDHAGGCELTASWDSRCWNLMTIIQNPDNDRLVIIDAGPNYSWIAADPNSGIVDAGGQRQINLNLSANNLDQGRYELTMIVEHNAAGEALRIPVALVVDPMIAETPDGKPDDYRLQALYPNPTNSAGTISFYLPREERVHLTIWDSRGRLAGEVFQGRLRAGSHTLPFIAGDWSSGVYFVQLETERSALARKFALMK